MWRQPIQCPTRFSLLLANAALTQCAHLISVQNIQARITKKNFSQDSMFDLTNEPHPAHSLSFVFAHVLSYAMNKTVIEVQVRAVLPTSGGCAVFLGNNEKVFIIYVDQTVGSAITMFMRHITKERPLTHDLMAHLLAALGAKVERVIINDLKNATYYARVIIQVENELQQKKIIELDGRPSDCIAMATQQK